jgi:hypothetical protein
MHSPAAASQHIIVVEATPPNTPTSPHYRQQEEDRQQLIARITATLARIPTTASLRQILSCAERLLDDDDVFDVKDAGIQTYQQLQLLRPSQQEQQQQQQPSPNDCCSAPALRDYCGAAVCHNCGSITSQSSTK